MKITTTANRSAFVRAVMLADPRLSYNDVYKSWIDAGRPPSLAPSKSLYRNIRREFSARHANASRVNGTPPAPVAKAQEQEQEQEQQDEDLTLGVLLAIEEALDDLLMQITQDRPKKRVLVCLRDTRRALGKVIITRILAREA